MVERQKQKQKQTVIVNIGDKIIRRKRKRKPRKKAGPSAPQYPPPAPPPSQDFARVIYQAQAIRPQDNLAVQLNSVTKQLQELEARQLHSTGNLMAGQAAIARQEGEQGYVAGNTTTQEVETQTETEDQEELQRLAMLAMRAEEKFKEDKRGRTPRARSRSAEDIPVGEPVESDDTFGFQAPYAKAVTLTEGGGFIQQPTLVAPGGGGGGGGGGGAAEQPEESLTTKPRKKKGPGRPSKEALAAEAAKQKDVTSFFTNK